MSLDHRIRGWVVGWWPMLAILAFLLCGTVVAILSVLGYRVPLPVLFAFPVLILVAFAGMGVERSRRGGQGG